MKCTMFVCLSLQTRNQLNALETTFIFFLSKFPFDSPMQIHSYFAFVFLFQFAFPHKTERGKENTCKISSGSCLSPFHSILSLSLSFFSLNSSSYTIDHSRFIPSSSSHVHVQRSVEMLMSVYIIPEVLISLSKHFYTHLQMDPWKNKCLLYRVNDNSKTNRI